MNQFVMPNFGAFPSANSFLPMINTNVVNNASLMQSNTTQFNMGFPDFAGGSSPWSFGGFSSPWSWFGGSPNGGFQPPQQQNNRNSLLGILVEMLMLLQGMAGQNQFKLPCKKQQTKHPQGFPFMFSKNGLGFGFGFIEVGVDPNGPNGSIWGDPHFVGFKGNKYDVMGQPDHFYNLLSDSNVQYNAKFVPWKGNEKATVVGEAGIQVGNAESGLTHVSFSLNGEALVDGVKLNDGESRVFQTGLRDMEGNFITGSAKLNGKDLIVNTGEYVITLMAKPDGYIDHKLQVTKLGVQSDGVLPHGLLGQTGRPDYSKGDGKQGEGAQGEGAIDGVYTDYEVGSLFDSQFKFNQFGLLPTLVQTQGVGVGVAAAAT